MRMTTCRGRQNREDLVNLFTSVSWHFSCPELKCVQYTAQTIGAALMLKDMGLHPA